MSRGAPEGAGAMTAIAVRNETDERIVGTFRKTRSEEVRVSVEQFRGREVVNVRVWWRGDDDGWRPSRKGLAISTDRLPDLLSLLQKAMVMIAARRASVPTAPEEPVRP